MLRRQRGKSRLHGATNPCARRSSGCQLRVFFGSAAAGIARENLLLCGGNTCVANLFLPVPALGAAAIIESSQRKLPKDQSLRYRVLHSRRVCVEGHCLEQSLYDRVLRFCQKGWCKGERDSSQKAGIPR
jgi:hypothetical protein